MKEYTVCIHIAWILGILLIIAVGIIAAIWKKNN